MADDAPLWSAIACLGLSVIGLLILVKFVVGAIDLIKPSWAQSLPYKRVVWRVPSWRLFGQSTGSFDIRIGIASQLGDDPATVDLEPVRRRKLSDWLLNPHSRYRAFRKRGATSLIETSVRQGPDAAANDPFAPQFEAIGGAMLQALRPADAHLRTYWVMVILDRGYFASTPPEALVQLGPYTIK